MKYPQFNLSDILSDISKYRRYKYTYRRGSVPEKVTVHFNTFGETLEVYYTPYVTQYSKKRQDFKYKVTRNIPSGKRMSSRWLRDRNITITYTGRVPFA